MAETPFSITFYTTPAGTAPMREFLLALPREARRKCGQYMYALEQEGLGLSSALIKKLGRDIWELRPEYEGIEYRFFFGRDGDGFVFVHAIAKKRQKTARSDIDLAQRRFNEWRDRSNG
jgi:phage-related protein